MTVTRFGDADLALRLQLARQPIPVRRRFEAWWLLAASLLVTSGLLLALFAKTQDFPEVRTGLGSGELVNLNAEPSPEDLSKLIADVFDDPTSRTSAVERLRSFLAERGPLPNLGILNLLRTAAADVITQDHHSAPRSDERITRRPGTKPLLPLSKLRGLAVVRTPGQFLRTFFVWITAYLAAFWFVHAAWRLQRFRGDQAILPALHLLTGIGLILMVSLRDPLRDTLEFRKFATGVIAGSALLLLPLFKAFQYRNISRWIYTPLLAALLLFAALLRFGSGPTGSDARVNLGPIQPVELIKIFIVLFLAGYFSQNWERLRDLRQKRFVPRWLRWMDLPRTSHALPVMFAIASSLAMFFLLKDMGPALVTGVLFLAIFAVARGRSGLALCGVVLLVAGVAWGYHLGTPHTVVQRVSMWLSPWDNDIRGGDQLAHSLWAFATGGPWGSGPGWGDPAVIPAGHTDLVLPAVAEEWGFCGVAAICLLFGILVIRTFRIALRAPDEHGFFLCAGFGTLLALEMLLISGGALGAIPLSGVVSPFLSSGNTAMLSNFLIFSVLLGVSNQAARLENPEAVTSGRRFAARFKTTFGGPVLVLSLVLGACSAALLARAAWLQIWQDQELLSRDALVYTSDGVKRPQHNPRLSLLAASIPRGDIFDRNGVLLATSSRSKLERYRDIYRSLGISVDASSIGRGGRLYPFGSATLHLLGDVRSGERFHAPNASLVEHDSNRKLQGYSDYRDLAPVVRYRHQRDNPALQALLGRERDVHTTIDIRLQLAAIGIVRDHLAKSGLKGATVMLDARSGDVLALVSWPAPAESSPSEDELLDRARYGEYPPGSTFKLVTAMAALRNHPDAASITYACQRLRDGRTGTVIAGWRRPIRDNIGDRVHGTLDMKQAITVSCNAYFAQLGVRTVGSKSLFETAQLLGINTGALSLLRETLPFASYGQGNVVTTPLKMARVAAAIADHGAMPQGRWVLDGSDGRNDAPVEVIPRSAASFLSDAMRSVVTDGTAHQAMKGVAVQLAGKTGTAQLDSGNPHSWFVGFAPYAAEASSAQQGASKSIAFAVIVEHGGYGAKVAAPIARELVEAAGRLGIIDTGAQR